MIHNSFYDQTFFSDLHCTGLLLILSQQLEGVEMDATEVPRNILAKENLQSILKAQAATL